LYEGPTLERGGLVLTSNGGNHLPPAGRDVVVRLTLLSCYHVAALGTFICPIRTYVFCKINHFSFLGGDPKAIACGTIISRCCSSSFSTRISSYPLLVPLGIWSDVIYCSSLFPRIKLPCLSPCFNPDSFPLSLFYLFSFPSINMMTPTLFGIEWGDYIDYLPLP